MCSDLLTCLLVEGKFWVKCGLGFLGFGIIRFVGSLNLLVGCVAGYVWVVRILASSGMVLFIYVEVVLGEEV